MSTATVTTSSTAARGDSLATGVMFMLALNVVQRAVGFVRGLLFCRFLSDAALGQFSLAYSFLMLAAPLVVLGLPGSLGRYVEFYRQRGQLAVYLRKMTIATLLLTGVGTLLMTCFARPLAYLVFDDAGQTRLMGYALATLCLVTVFNYLNELLTSLRQVRAVSFMQFVNSLTFTIAGVGLVFVWESSAEAIVVAFAISCVAAIVSVLPWLSQLKAEFAHDTQSLRGTDAWSKLLPFAMWVWLTNLVANLADFVDRFMILHVSGLDTHAGQALVGQYHSSRVVPLLFATLAATLAAIVLPHWSHAWETGQKSKVSAHVNLAVKLLAILFTVGSLLVLWCAPLLFGVVLGGKYDDGLAALPWALVGCVWFSLLLISQNYLLCAEKARLVMVACLLGLILNVAFNLVALPWGLTAILAARACASLAAAIAVLLCGKRFGLHCSRGLIIALALPLIILAGPIFGPLLVVAIVVIDWRLRWLFDEDEERQLKELATRLATQVKDKLLPA